MNEYFTSITLLGFLALATLTVLVYENNRFRKDEKKRFYLTYLMIFLALITEWGATILNGAPDWTVGIHAVIKGLDYMFTPIAGVCFAYQVAEKKGLPKWIYVVLGLNVLLQAVSIFTGWTFYISEDNYFIHGPLHILYILVYCSAIVIVITEFTRFGKQFGKQNRVSLILSMSIIIVGIIIQETSGLRTFFASLVMMAILMFVHYNEYIQLRNDDYVSYQRRLLETDVLTNLDSRYAYSHALEKYAAEEKLPEKLVVFSIDINGLKKVNDSMGHLAGDELIQGAAKCIHDVLSPYGECFRTGGDEFIALVEIEAHQAITLKKKLMDVATRWKGNLVKELNLAVGYCILRDSNEKSIEKVISSADHEMYKEKNRFYQKLEAQNEEV